MVGKNHLQLDVNNAPVVVLIEPQLGENIGAVARAMLNCGLGDLRIVKPRDGWPNERAVRASSGAESVIKAAGIYNTAAAAVADLQHVFACTARPRDMQKVTVDPEEAANMLRYWIASGHACGVLFGGERSGLCNDDVALADTILSIPLNPGFSSLNLAQAVLLVAYSWIKLQNVPLEGKATLSSSPSATKNDLFGFFDHLETELLDGGFFYPPEKAPTMIRNIRAIFQRAELSEREIKTLRGVIAAIKKAGSS